MKKFLLFLVTIVISVNQVYACSYYPYGEDIRISLLKPNLVFPNDNIPFFYTSSQFYNEGVAAIDFDIYDSENVELWYAFLNKIVSKKDIYEGVYIDEVSELKNKNSSYPFVKHLNEIGRQDILEYLIFAKSCSYLNSWESDPWEREEKSLKLKRKKQMKNAMRLAKKSKDTEIQRRYAHLAIRLAFYNWDEKSVLKIYNQYFSSAVKRDAIDYWALHFKLHFDASGIERNIAIASVFANSKEKRFAVHHLFDKSISLNLMLAKASNDTERAAICYLLGSITMDRGLPFIKKLNQYDANSPHLTELIVREINKMEDWILTPYYSNFEPSTPFSWDEPTLTPNLLQEKVNEDRVYAAEFGRWLASLDSKAQANNEWHSTFIFYATFLSGNKQIATTQFQELAKKGFNDDNLDLFHDKMAPIIAVIGDLDPKLDKNSTRASLLRLGDNNNQYLFATARELEIKGNKDLAACLLARLSGGENAYSMAWKSSQHHFSVFQDFYYEYFTYLDVAYSIEEMNQLIEFVESKTNSTSEFDKWLMAEISRDPTRLYDLLGTKYLRADNLEEAKTAYLKVDQAVWESETYQYKTYLNEDPFVNNFFQKGINPQEDSKRSYTKPEIISKLINLKAEVASTAGDRQAKAAYKVANCYRNMTYYGNAWMMRRYFWSGYMHQSGIEDDPEYFGCLEAKRYYIIASKSAKTMKFAALALRMAGECEGYRLLSEVDFYGDSDEYDKLFASNAIYKELRTKFPEDYEPLTSNCDRLIEYYKSVN